jgi:hypothetical protein
MSTRRRARNCWGCRCQLIVEAISGGFNLTARIFAAEQQRHVLIRWRKIPRLAEEEGPIVMLVTFTRQWRSSVCPGRIYRDLSCRMALFAEPAACQDLYVGRTTGFVLCKIQYPRINSYIVAPWRAHDRKEIKGQLGRAVYNTQKGLMFEERISIDTTGCKITFHLIARA